MGSRHEWEGKIRNMVTGRRGQVRLIPVPICSCGWQCRFKVHQLPSKGEALALFLSTKNKSKIKIKSNIRTKGNFVAFVFDETKILHA